MADRIGRRDAHDVRDMISLTRCMATSWRVGWGDSSALRIRQTACRAARAARRSPLRLRGCRGLSSCVSRNAARRAEHVLERRVDRAFRMTNGACACGPGASPAATDRCVVRASASPGRVASFMATRPRAAKTRTLPQRPCPRSARGTRLAVSTANTTKMTTMCGATRAGRAHITRRHDDDSKTARGRALRANVCGAGSIR